MSEKKDDRDFKARQEVEQMGNDELRDFLLACPHCVNKGLFAGCDKREDGLIQCSNCKTMWDNWSAWCRSCNWHKTSSKSLRLLAKNQESRNDKKKQRK